MRSFGTRPCCAASRRGSRGTRAAALRKGYAAGEVIFRKGDDAQGVMVVAAGRVKIVSVSEAGTEVIHNLIDEGEVFGEIALLDGEPRSADAVAGDDGTTVLQVLRRRLHADPRRQPRRDAGHDDDPVRAHPPGHPLRGGTPSSWMRACACCGGSVDSRVQYGRRNAAGELIIEHGLSQQEIGDSVGLTRVSINRQLAAWRDAGLIEYRRGVIEVRDLAALEELVADAA